MTKKGASLPDTGVTDLHTGADNPENPPAASQGEAVPASTEETVGGPTSSAHAADPLESRVHQYHEPGGSEGSRVSPRRDAGVDLAKQLEAVAKEREKLTARIDEIEKVRGPLLLMKKKDLDEDDRELLERLEKEMARLDRGKERLDQREHDLREKERRLDEKEILLLQRAQGHQPLPGATPVHDQPAAPVHRLPLPHPQYPPRLVAAYHASASCFAVMCDFIPAGNEEVERDRRLFTVKRNPVATPPDSGTHYSASQTGTERGAPLVARYNKMVEKTRWVPSLDVASEGDVSIDMGETFRGTCMEYIRCKSNQSFKFECPILTEIHQLRTTIVGIPDYIVTLEADRNPKQISRPSAQDLYKRRCVFVEVESGGKGYQNGLVQLQVTMEAFLGNGGDSNVNSELMYGICLCDDSTVAHLLAFREGYWYQDGHHPAKNIAEYCEKMLTRDECIAPPRPPSPHQPQAVAPPELNPFNLDYR